MRKTIFLFFLSIAYLKASAQQVKNISIEDIERIKLNRSDTLYVVNFWATWCKPCIEELPAFEKIDSLYHGKVKVMLVSLDARKEIDSRLIPFIKSRKLHSEVYILDAADMNRAIDRVSTSWSGVIPATLISGRAQASKLFFEKQLTFEELNGIIEPLIK